mgnify:CR=1 FL=1
MNHLEETQTIAAAADKVWPLLSDPSLVASCIPGATLTGSGDDGVYRGTIRVKFGPTVVNFRGEATLVYDHAARRCTIEGRGVDQRGASRAVANGEISIAPAGAATALSVAGDFHITGPLQGFADTVRRVLHEAGAQGEWLELELTERMLMADVGSAPATLAALRAQGLKVSVDDFGTGTTSLAHLTQLPLDKLKIDQGFVAKLPDDASTLTITRAIVQMARGLGLRVGAEGVRTQAQWDLLAELGCDDMQGELIAPSMPAEQFEQWLRARPYR